MSLIVTVFTPTNVTFTFLSCASFTTFSRTRTEPDVEVEVVGFHVYEH